VSSRGSTRTRPAATPRRVQPDRSRARRTPSRPPRRVRRRTWVVSLAIVVLLGALGGFGYFGPVLAVKTIDVDGNVAVDTQQIVSLLDVPIGQPLPRVDTDGAANRVATIPKVASVRVQRVYPSTVRVTVEERKAVVFFDAPDGTHLMDAAGVDFAVEPWPPGAVQLVVASPSFGNLETRAALAVLTSLPPQLRSQIARIDAPSISAVSMTLLDGRVLVWGSSEDSERKAAVALPLLTQPGQTYDVSSPDLPTTR
jgi:cell division protein FtsQ